MHFTQAERRYPAGQLLARPATVDPDGIPQDNPVGFLLDEASGHILVGGLDLANTRTFRSVREHPGVALVVDDPGAVPRERA